MERGKESGDCTIQARAREKLQRGRARACAKGNATVENCGVHLKQHTRHLRVHSRSSPSHSYQSSPAAPQFPSMCRRLQKRDASGLIGNP